MIIFETLYNNLKVRIGPSNPVSYEIPTSLGPMSSYPRLITGDSLATQTFTCSEQGYYNVYIQVLLTPMSGRISCKLGIRNTTLSSPRLDSDFPYARLLYLGTFFVSESTKEFLIITLEQEFLGQEVIAGKIFVDFDENAFR
jgi:hypothetical protein